MSFSKARIQRFNELTSEAPPPGAYDPKFDRKVKGTIIDKPGKSHHDAKSTTSSGAECNASVSSRGTSNASVKQFRTPQVPKKRVIAKPTGMSCPRVKTKLYNSESKDSQTPYEPLHELADLKVECANKDKTIHEYEKQMDDMKAEISDLNEKFEILQKKHAQIEEQHQKDIESMAKLQQEVMENKNEKYLIEMQALQSQLTSALETKKELICEKNKIEEELNAKISSLKDELQKFKEQIDIVDKMEKLQLATQKLDKMTEELNEALNLKDMQMADLLNLQAETERKLSEVQIELKKSEKEVAELEANLESIENDSIPQALPMTSELIEKMTTVLQEYFDYDNYDGKWNIEKMSFSPEIEEFLKNIRKFVTDLKLTYEREIELSRDNFNEERENLEQDLEMKRSLIIDLENKLAETNETNAFLTEELQDVQKLYKDVNRNMHEVKADLEEANEKYAKVVASHKGEIELMTKIHEEEQTKLKDLLEEARSEYLKELDNMTTARNEELAEVKKAMDKRIEDEKKRMKECANKMVENAEAITRETLKACKAESEERVRRVIAETDAKVSVLTREAKTASEEELRQVTEKYNASLDLLESEKASLNTKLAQRDLDVIRLTAALEEMKCTAETQESFSQSLQAELDRAEAELVEKKEELRNLKDQIRTESAEMVARRRRFEVVMAENQASVAALTRRLAQSEAEVERLQRELQTKEGSLVGYRELLDNITSNSKMAQEQLDTITDKIDEKVEHISQMEVQSVNEINAAKTMFNAKIESLRTVTIEELAKVQKECQEKSERNAELQGTLSQMADRLSEATDMLLKLEEINDEQSIEMSKLQLQNTKLMQQLDNKDQTLEEHKMCYELQSEQYKLEINEMNDQLSRLRGEIKLLKEQKDAAEDKKYDFEELKLKYNDQVEQLTEKLKSEKTQREKLEKQVKQYERTCERLAEECQQITDKYTEVVSHNNHKQRIKHVSQLKEKINNQQLDLLRLRQELDSKTNLIEELRLANEKLKLLEERRHVGQGKENLHSMAGISSPLAAGKTLFPKSANTTPVSSPHKPHTPLRDRNE
ncbi:myosin-15-like isoform X1 [Nasonia vitripennis]|uniref:Hyaluronan mediated motility receptor n=1 Tax=Nasonia vitripennis TaxID=7425 RepID=A0A7M7IX05_NASVI|nr:myosin-15-like isoform X1 [Nasonia vitripennis]